MARVDGREAADMLRPINMTPNYLHNAAGSVLIEFGKTRVLCAVSVVPTVPRWMREQRVKGGWLTSEYQMMPAAGDRRKPRDSGRPDGRSQEIQRLIGRSLRAVVDLTKLGENTFYVDCDVLDADGGTRCASVNGAVVALQLAFREMIAAGKLESSPMQEMLAAVSVGIVAGEPLLDLCYREDADAEVDMNVVMTAGGKYVEIQGTGEGHDFTRQQMNQMLDLAETGIAQIGKFQQQLLAN